MRLLFTVEVTNDKVVLVRVQIDCLTLFEKRKHPSSSGKGRVPCTRAGIHCSVSFQIKIYLPEDW